MNDIGTLVLGIVISLVGAFINNFGVVLQKRQVNIKAPPNQTEKTVLDIGTFFKDPIWVLGILMQTIIYLPFLLYAYELIKITLAAPLSNAGIIFLVLGLMLLVNEKLRGTHEYAGVIILIIGVITVALGNVQGDATIAGFMGALSNFWLVFGLILAISFASLLPIFRYKSERRLMFYGILIGNCYAFVAISLQWLVMGITEATHPLGGLFLMIGIIGAVLGSVVGILATQEAYKRGNAIYVVPFVQVTVNIFPIIAGVLIFQQVIWNPLFFWIGIISIIIGASLLARFEGE
ncbi:MAG: hypothetical protein EU536_01385 [Promethearchaeota archaeon]|nr:MAG: hypothetical protein EU536_01385 [Candidatus Lokiarchaeota archaeon]